MGRAASFAALTIVALTAVATPTRAAEVAVPASLEPWVPWVLAEHPDLACALVDGERHCAWPGRLVLELDDRGGAFRFEATADRDVVLGLPGDATHWPLQVTLDGEPALLRRAADRPTVVLPRGRHRLTGRFRWNRLPQSLPVPLEVALISLSIDGRPVGRPRREANGLLWLAGRQGELEEERVAIQVSRRIDDGVPVRMTVLLALRVSGQPREIDLGDPLPAGFVPTAVASSLPVRLATGEEGARRLLVQLRPGDWRVELTARSLGPVERIALAQRPEPWPREEFWAFRSDVTVRSVKLQGAPGVDPQRTPLPEEWRSLPAFRVEPGSALTFTELLRGRPPPPPDEIEVRREWWLAEDGSQITSRDRLLGRLHRGGRLEALDPARLGRVALGEESADQVVTVGTATERAGVEVRAEDLDLQAELVYPGGGRLPAVGWDRYAPELSIRLNLPPGWQLVAAPGVDRAVGSLLDAWDLYDLFFLLLATLATWKLSSWRLGVLAFLVLGLAWHEPYTPFLVFWWLLLLLWLALLRVVPPGRAARVVNGLRWAAAAAFAFQLVLFCTSQWRTGIFPQLEYRYWGYGGETAPSGDPGFTTFDRLTGYEKQMTSAGLSAPPLPGKFKRYGAPVVRDAQTDTDPRKPQLTPEAEEKLSSLGYLGSGGGYRARQIDAAAVVQTGPGVPGWSWHVYALYWSGPVAPDQRLRLLMISPGVERILSLLRIAGSIFLALWLLDPRRHPRPGASDGGGNPKRAAAVLALLLPLLAATAAAQPADEAGLEAAPPASILAELERRLSAPPPCHPKCVEVASVALTASGPRLRIEAEVHAAAATAWALPGPAVAWTPDRVAVDGVASSTLRRDGHGFLLLRLDPGVHRVTLSGPADDSLTLQMPRPPRVMRWRGDGWEIAGFRADAPPPASVRLNRILPAAAESGSRADLSPSLILTRELDLGIPWLVHNQLERSGSADLAVAVEVPLLTGESVTTAGIPVENGAAAITLERGETTRRWNSTLEETDSLTLTAPDAPWLERWELVCSPIWSCRTDGLAPSRRMAEGSWRPQWRPWPGETLTIALQRPAAAPGATTTLDTVRASLSPGRRILTADLAVDLRTSQGGEQRVALPEAAELQSFRVDGNEQPVQVEAGAVLFTVEPGAHEIRMRWRQPNRLGLIERAPRVALGGPAANVTVELAVPSNRWLLWAAGPRWGSEVTLWLYLPLLALAAWALGRWRVTPLSALDWLLLGLGLTQVYPLFAAVVVLWLLLFGLRDRLGEGGKWRRRLRYLLLGGLWLAALGVLYAVVHIGLLGRPEMQVVGLAGGGDTLEWYRDLVPGELPRPWVIWLPLWVFRALMLFWALWLANRLLRWLPWAWTRLVMRGAGASRSGAAE